MTRLYITNCSLHSIYTYCKSLSRHSIRPGSPSMYNRTPRYISWAASLLSLTVFHPIRVLCMYDFHLRGGTGGSVISTRRGKLWHRRSSRSAHHCACTQMRSNKQSYDWSQPQPPTAGRSQLPLARSMEIMEIDGDMEIWRHGDMEMLEMEIGSTNEEDGFLYGR